MICVGGNAKPVHSRQNIPDDGPVVPMAGRVIGIAVEGIIGHQIVGERNLGLHLTRQGHRDGQEAE